MGSPGICQQIDVLKPYMEKDESGSKFARRWASLDVCIGLLGSMLGLDGFGGQDLYLPVTDELYPLILQYCPYQTGHNDFGVREEESPGFFVLVSGSERISSLVYPASRTNVDYPIS